MKPEHIFSDASKSVWQSVWVGNTDLYLLGGTYGEQDIYRVLFNKMSYSDKKQVCSLETELMPDPYPVNLEFGAVACDFQARHLFVCNVKKALKMYEQ